MVMPFASGFRVTSPFGSRTDPVTGEKSAWHSGVDLIGEDRNVRAVIGGTVLRSRIITDPENPTSEWGNYVSIYGEDGRMCYYCHLASRAVESGQRVEAGQIIGIEGMTGKATGVHLHFEVRSATGTQLDPCAYLCIENRAGYIWPPEPPYLSQAHDWAREAVKKAVERGIIRGKGGDDLALGDTLTREELLVILDRAGVL